MKKLGLVAILSIMMIVSCGEDVKEAKSTTVNLEMTVGSESLALDQTYDINGTPIQFTNVAFYVGDMTFKTSDNTTFANEGDNRYQLVKPGMTNYSFSIPYTEDAPDVTLDEVSFIVGVDADTNAQDETTFEMRADGDPLGAQNPTMHWGWTGKYRFLNIDANADLDGDGVFETPLVYHLGKDQFLGNITLNPSIKLEEGQNDLMLKADFAEMLSGVDFSTEQFTKAGTDEAGLAMKILDNYQTAFTIEK